MFVVAKLEVLWIQEIPSKEVASFPVAPPARYVPSAETDIALILDRPKELTGNT
jgi:DNA polymerase sigma